MKDPRNHFIRLKLAQQIGFGEARDAVAQALEGVSLTAPLIENMTQALGESLMVMKYLSTTVPVYGWDPVMNELLPFPVKEWLIQKGSSEALAESCWDVLSVKLRPSLEEQLREYRPTPT